MNYLRKTSYVFALAVLYLSSVASAQSALGDSCLLKLSVMDSSKSPVTGASVELLSSEGRAVFTTQTADGYAEICDGDFGIYSLRVGSSSCFPTTISGLWFTPGQPIDLKLILNSCNKYHLTRIGCSAYLRVRASPDDPVHQARAWVNGTTWEVKGDIFGRLLIWLTPGQTTRAMIGAPGFTPVPVMLICNDVENIERTILLERAQ